MGFSTSTCTEFVEVLASKAPVPGGGGASALVGAVGTALGNMVGSLTVGKKKYADVEDEMYELKAKCDQLQKDFLHLIERRDPASRKPEHRSGVVHRHEKRRAGRADAEGIRPAALSHPRARPRVHARGSDAEGLELRLLRRHAHRGRDGPPAARKDRGGPRQADPHLDAARRGLLLRRITSPDLLTQCRHRIFGILFK